MVQWWWQKYLCSDGEAGINIGGAAATRNGELGRRENGGGRGDALAKQVTLTGKQRVHSNSAHPLFRA